MSVDEVLVIFLLIGLDKLINPKTMEKTLEQLEAEKNEAYTRPEKYKFERTNKLLAWAGGVLQDADTKMANFFNLNI